MREVSSDQARADLAAALARDLRQLDLNVAAAFVESQEREVERLQQRDAELATLESRASSPDQEYSRISPLKDCRPAELDGLRLQLAEAEALIRRLLTTEKDIAPHDRRRGERLLVTLGELLVAKQQEGASGA